MTWNDIIIRAVKRSGLTMHAVSIRAKVPYPRVHRIMNGGGLTLRSAEAIARAVGLELREVKRSKRKG